MLGSVLRCGGSEERNGGGVKKCRGKCKGGLRGWKEVIKRRYGERCGGKKCVGIFPGAHFPQLSAHWPPMLIGSKVPICPKVPISPNVHLFQSPHAIQIHLPWCLFFLVLIVSKCLFAPNAHFSKSPHAPNAHLS